MSFQVAVSAMLLVAGRAGTVSGLNVAAVRPEGFEDVDCELDDGSCMLVQSKERGRGARAIANAELADIIVHAVPAMLALAKGSAYRGASDKPARARDDLPALDALRFAIVTDGRFGSSLPTTGWDNSLADVLANRPGDSDVREALLAKLRDRLGENEHPSDLADELLARTHLVILPQDLAAQTLRLLNEDIGLHPVIAGLARARLLSDLTEAAATQREAELRNAHRRTRADLDTLVNQISQTTDVSSLEEAVRHGVCEPADYTTPSPVGAAAFFDGVAVAPTHIAAGLDVVRPEETNAILEGLADRRHAVIAGPSGSGKSALLWRAARLLGRGPRIVRVLRVADSSDVQLLIRHVRRQEPRLDMQVLVCADDLGRDRMALWPEARRQLEELPGVLLLAAVRQENLTPAASADAAIIDPRLSDTSAGQIYDAIQTAGMPAVLEREEALQQANGLLMEFIALTTTGRRLRTVLAAQVEDLGQPGRELQREALRLVCAAHTLGFSVPADSLPSALSAEAAPVGDAMKRLVGEHLVVGAESAWQGVHDLRAEVLLELLHASPPPSLAATYGASITALPDAAHAHAARRAAVQLARATVDASAIGVAAPQERLAEIQHVFRPVAEALGHALGQLAERALGAGDSVAEYAAGILETADRLDTIAYAHAVLPLLEASCPPTLDVSALAFMTYGAAVDGVTLGIDALDWARALARRFPSRDDACARLVARRLLPSLFVRFAASANLASAVRLCEAAEGIVTISAEQAREVYRLHVPRLPQPPGDTPVEYAELRFRLTASLSVLAELYGNAVAESFGPTMARAEDAVAVDPYGCEVELTFRPADLVPNIVANQARQTTYDGERMLVARAVTFTRLGEEAPPTSYRTQPGDKPTSLNSQAVLVARRLFDACPEIDQVDIAIWQATRRPLRILDSEPGTKSLRAGVLKRVSETARNVAFQAAVAEARGAENWTSRLRQQSKLAQDLIPLLEELPRRLRPFDNARQRSEWRRRVEDAATQVARLPGRPPERPAAVLAGSAAATLARTAAQIDESLREKDQARHALDTVTGALLQCARTLTDIGSLRGAGVRLAGAPGELREGRQQGAPTLIGIGDALPPALDSLTAFSAKLLTAVGQPKIDSALGRGVIGRADLTALLTELARDSSRYDAQIVERRLATAGISSMSVTVPDSDPLEPWRDQQTITLLDIADWFAAVTSLQSWPVGEREAGNLAGRVIAMPTAGQFLLPMGLQTLRASAVLPLRADAYLSVSEVLGTPLQTNRAGADIAELAQQLNEYSYEQVRRASRDPSWQPQSTSAPTPQQTAEQIARWLETTVVRTEPGSVESPYTRMVEAVNSLLHLSELVAREAGDDEGLAHQLAEVDLTDLTNGTPKEALRLFMAAHTAALEADHLSAYMSVDLYGDEPRRAET
ncbi:hypothetical protein [Flindersiella endophytica]